VTARDGKLFHPFSTLEAFERFFKSVSNQIFDQFDASVDFDDNAIEDAYFLWRSDVERWAGEIQPKFGLTDVDAIERATEIPSTLKKAGALTAAINRCKPIRQLNRRLYYEYKVPKPFQLVAGFYPNEYIAFEAAKRVFLAAELKRKDMAELSDFLQVLNLDGASGGVFSENFVNDVCYYLRSRAPSSTSIYMFYQAFWAIPHVWRRLNHEPKLLGA